MKYPKPFKLKLNFHMKKRQVKKFIKTRERNIWNRYIQFHNYEGLINTCSGLNINPEQIIPIYYYNYRKPKQKFLYDIEFVGKNHSCSFYHCGVDKPKSYKECINYINEITNGPDDQWGIKERYKTIQIDQDGVII